MIVALDIVRVIAGLVILIIAADRLVISAVRIAKILEISPVIIGAVIVGFGTSVPEFVVSAISAGQGNLELAISNVTASNISNMTLVLGVGAMVAVLSAKRRVIKREGVMTLIAVSMLGGLLLTGSLSRWAGVFLLVAMAVAIALLVTWSIRDENGAEADLEAIEADESRLGVEAIYGVAAMIATIVAGQVLLTGVEGIGEEVGLSVVFMGLITGVGTSLPELSAAVAGARRGQADIVLGNVLGSNTFNSLGVAGLAAVIGPGSTGAIDLPIIALMIGSAVLAGIFAATGQRLNRFEGVALVLIFAGYAVAST